MTTLSFKNDAGGRNTFAPRFAEIVFRTVLTANAEQHFTVPMPTGFSSPNYSNWAAVFSYSSSANVYVSDNVTATIPGSSFSSANASPLNPTTRIVNGGDVLSFITSTSGGVGVTVELYAVS
jgi:hypothetical protein